jgi:hypothetical protein
MIVDDLSHDLIEVGICMLDVKLPICLRQLEKVSDSLHR